MKLPSFVVHHVKQAFPVFFQAMFFADQLLSRIPQQGQVFHNFEATTITIDKPPNLTAGKKVPSKVF